MGAYSAVLVARSGEHVGAHTALLAQDGLIHRQLDSSADLEHIAQLSRDATLTNGA